MTAYVKGVEVASIYGYYYNLLINSVVTKVLTNVNFGKMYIAVVPNELIIIVNMLCIYNFTSVSSRITSNLRVLCFIRKILK